MAFFHDLNDFFILFFSLTGLAVKPVIVTAPMDIKGNAHLLNRIVGAVFLDELKDYFRLFWTKMAVAFFNISIVIS